MGRVRGRAEETGRARGMQGSSGGASSLLYIYSAAVTVWFFDAVALALFAPDLRGRRFRTAVCNSRRLGRPRAFSLRRLAAMLWGRKVRDCGAPLPAREARALPKRKRRLRNRRSLKEHRSKDLCGAQAWKPVFPAAHTEQRRDALLRVQDTRKQVPPGHSR